MSFPCRAFCHKVSHTLCENLILCDIPPTFDVLLKYTIENMAELVKLALCRKFPEHFTASMLETRKGIKETLEGYHNKIASGALPSDRAIDRLVTFYEHPIDNYPRMTTG